MQLRGGGSGTGSDSSCQLYLPSPLYGQSCPINPSANIVLMTEHRCQWCSEKYMRKYKRHRHGWGLPTHTAQNCMGQRLVIDWSVVDVCVYLCVCVRVFVCVCVCVFVFVCVYFSTPLCNSVVCLSVVYIISIMYLLFLPFE